MSEPLALKYRPAQFSDMVGQKLNAVVLQRMVDEKNVPPGILISGPSGVGKTTAARILAQTLEASDVIEVDAASTGGVSEIRKLLEVVRYSTGGSYRVVILDEAQSITRQGFEAFLKTLEEPPENTIFVFVTTEPNKIPEVILSRLFEFQFRSVVAGDIAERLAWIAAREDVSIDAKLIGFLAQESQGNMRSAVQSMDKVIRAGVATIEEYRSLVGDTDPAPKLMEAMLSGDHDKIFSMLDEVLSTVGSPSQVTSSLIACIRDMFIFHAGGSPDVTGEGFEYRRLLAKNIEPQRLQAAAQMLWEVKTKLRTIDDPRGTLELVVMLISEIFTRGLAAPVSKIQKDVPPQTTETSSEPDAPKRLTIAELQKLGSTH